MQKGYPFVMLAGVLFGTIIFGGKILSNLGLSAYEIAVIPYIVPILILLPIILLNRKYWPRWNQLPIWLAYGLICALSAFTEFSPVVMGVPVSIVILLLYSQPIWSLLFTVLFMKEKIHLKDIIASIIVLIGVTILINPFGEKIPNILGVIIALFSGVTLAAWLVIGSYASKKHIHPFTIKFCESVFQIIFLILLLPIAIILFKDPSLTSFSFHYSAAAIVAIILFGVFSQTLSHLAYFKGVRSVPTMHASVITLLEPVVAVLLSCIFLKEVLTLNIIIGGALILVANYIVIKK